MREACELGVRQSGGALFVRFGLVRTQAASSQSVTRTSGEEDSEDDEAPATEPPRGHWARWRES